MTFLDLWMTIKYCDFSVTEYTIYVPFGTIILRSNQALEEVMVGLPVPIPKPDCVKT